MRELIRYGCIGLLSTFTHISVGWLFVKMYAFEPVIGNSIAFFASFVVAFIGNSIWTFSGHGQKAVYSLAKYSTTVTIGLLYNTVCVYGLVSIGQMDYMKALVFIIVSWPFISFVFLKFWVFSK